MASAGRHVCITGISGFTGAHLAERLLAQGWQVSGIGPERVDGTVDHLDVDIGDRASIASWLVRVRPTHVIHLAALSHVVGEPLPFYQVNLLGTEALIEAIATAIPALEKLVIASSANVYGNARTLPIDEGAPVRPVNHYALSKAAVELLATKWFDRLPIVVVRPFNYTGPGQSEAFVFAKLAAAFRRRDPVIRLGNTDVARDLSDVGFVCEAYRRLLDAPARGVTFNICSGRCVSLAEAIVVLGNLTGQRPDIETDSRLVRDDEVKRLVGDPSRLFAAVGPIDIVPLHETFASMLTAG